MEGKQWAWLLGGLVAAGFGRGFQAISAVAWLEPVFFLQFLHHCNFQEGRWLRRLSLFAAAVIAQAAGLTFAMAGALADPSFNPLGVTIVAVAATLGSIILVLIPYLGCSAYRHRYPGADTASIFFFPTVITGLWIVYARVSPFGTMAHPAYSQSDWKPLVLTASFWGMSGIMFLMSWGASLLHELLLSQSPRTAAPKSPNLTPSQPYTGEPVLHTPLLLRRYSVAEPGASALSPGVAWHVCAFGVVFLLALVYGGTQSALFSGRFYQRGIAETYHKTFAASCIMEDEARGSALEGLWSETEDRVAAGDDVVLWSETAALVRGDVEEAELIARAGALVRQAAKSRHGTKPGPFIGLSYYKSLEEPHLTQRNGRSHIRRRGSAPESNAERSQQGGLNPAQEQRGLLTENSNRDLGLGISDGVLYGLDGRVIRLANRDGYHPSFWGYADDVIADGLHGTGAATNSFVLVGPSGDPILKYNKTHVVPIEEDEVVPGTGELAVAETGLGIMSGAVCFDFRFPELLRQAGQKSVALMLQPAWTWGPVGLVEAYVGAFRAVENGFHLFRCSSSGYSAAVSPLYDFEFLRETLTNGTITAELPILPHVPTFYASYGYVLEYVCIAIGALFYLLAVTPKRLVSKVSKYWPVIVKDFFFGSELDLDGLVDSGASLEAGSSYTSLQQS